MTRYVGPIVHHTMANFHPPGINPNNDDWCHLVSNIDKADLEAFLTANFATIACPTANIRTPADGSTVTYVALDAGQRAAAIAAGAGATPSDGKCYAQVFDKVVGSTWEPT